MRFWWTIPVSAVLCLALTLGPSPVRAQAPATPTPQVLDPTTVRAGGGRPAKEPATNPVFDRDHKEDMRLFVQGLAGYARALKPDFGIVTIDGLELLTKIDLFDPDVSPAAETYIRSLDAVMTRALFYGEPDVDSPVEKDLRVETLDALKRARDNGLAVLVVDYAKNAKKITDSYVRNQRAGFVSYAAPDKGPRLNRLARAPYRPFRENPKSVSSLAQVRNFVLVRNSAPFGSQAEFVLKMADTNYDLVIVDIFHRREQFLTRDTVDGLKFKKLGARRLVFAYLDIGTAASYRHYWQKGWGEGNPAWIMSPLPREPDRFYVQYTHPDWQDYIFGDTASVIYGLVMDLGFDGVVLDGIETYRFFDGTLE